MITRRKFLVGALTLTAGALAASHYLPGLKEETGELVIQMSGVDSFKVNVPYDCRIKNVDCSNRILIKSNGRVVGEGNTLRRDEILVITSSSSNTEVKIGLIRT